MRAYAAGSIGEQIGEREQREDLVDAGQRGVDESVDVVAIEVRAAIDDLGDRCRANGRGNRRAAAAADKLSRVESRLAGDGRRRRSTTGAPITSRERRGWIGRQQQRSFAAPREERGDPDGARRFSDAALADDERSARKAIEERVERAHSSSLSRATRTGPPLVALAEPLAPRADLAQAHHQLGFAAHVLVVVDVAELELHLQLHELLLDRLVVGELFLDDLLHLVRATT